MVYTVHLVHSLSKGPYPYSGVHDPGPRTGLGGGPLAQKVQIQTECAQALTQSVQSDHS
jgi:hypothetical protein